MEDSSVRQKIKKHGTAIAFVLGFIWDNIMLSQIDHVFANIMLGSYLVISAFSILIMNLPFHPERRVKIIEKITKWFPLILQFCFGSLFSAYIIFYTRSASISNNWPFLLFLVLLVISNELLRKRYLSITLPVSLFFTVLFSYNIFSLPILLKSMSALIFILSGLATLIIITIFIWILSRIAPEKYASSKRSLILSLSAIYILFNVAYFTNIIPPVPLALKEIGVYHSVTRLANGEYTLSFEHDSWYPFISNTDSTFHQKPNESVYVWSSIFAPTDLTVPIYYRWQYFDDAQKKWIETDLIQLPIFGGRDEGFRGYTKKSNVQPGLWRVDVETNRKNLIGRIEFTVEDAIDPINSIVTETK
ncbi:MAG: DUF2914 domain-containing protein [Patescibacteria group bacterium]